MEGRAQERGWSARVNTSLEKFEGELNQVAGKIETVQTSRIETAPKRRGREGARPRPRRPAPRQRGKDVLPS